MKKIIKIDCILFTFIGNNVVAITTERSCIFFQRFWELRLISFLNIISQAQVVHGRYKKLKQAGGLGTRD